jgi:hypothetical protein
MTKKHFIEIAAVLNDTGAPFGTCNALADVFAADNPRFDRAVFLTACGVVE